MVLMIKISDENSESRSVNFSFRFLWFLLIDCRRLTNMTFFPGVVRSSSGYICSFSLKLINVLSIEKRNEEGK